MNPSNELTTTYISHILLQHNIYTQSQKNQRTTLINELHLPSHIYYCNIGTYDTIHRRTNDQP